MTLRVPVLLHELVNLLARNGIHPDNGRRYMATRSITNSDSPYTIAASDCIILADATSGAITVNLPTAANHKNRVLIVKRINSIGSNVTISRTGSDTIEDATSITLSAKWGYRMVVSGGSTTWYILSST